MRALVDQRSPYRIALPGGGVPRSLGVMDDSRATRRRGIGSLETGLRVLSALAAAGGPAPLGEIARRAGLPPSQAHRYLASLIIAGFAAQPSEGGLYDLSAGALRLGLAALARQDALREADGAMMEFVTRTGRTALIAVRGDAGPTVVRWHPGNPPVLTSIALGSVLPLLRSATGHVFLAFGDRPFMDEAAQRAAVADQGTTPLEMDAIRRQVRAALCARVAGALIPGLRAAAAPVLDAPALIACGHVHQWREHQADGFRHVWSPAIGFIVGDPWQETYGTKLLGWVEHELRADGTHESRLCTVDGLALHDIGHMPELYGPLPRVR
ncbi:helix-turn-helix domain-containing protein [Leptolyngbya sp. 15MV]|nr:helix-turn-helix domain-containing protein [Leptolyngbya sp. 15MV]